VDTVVRIEGDRHGTLRFIRAIKHRFGPTGEVGLLEMVSEGLRDLPDAALTLRGPRLDVPGVVFTVTNDGSRSLLVEMQALVASSSGSPRRVAHQVSSQRLSLLLASSRRAAALIPAQRRLRGHRGRTARERTRRRRGARAGGRVGGVGFRGSEQPGCRGRGGPRGRAARGQRALSPGARSIPFGSHDGHRARAGELEEVPR